VADPPFLTRDPVDPAASAAAVLAAQDGAVASFTGLVRDHQNGRAVLWLEYEAHEQMAEKLIGGLVEEARRRWPVHGIDIRHRLGHLEIGEVSVVIAVAAPHRADALEACRWLIDTLKAEVPIFKKEAYADGQSWVEAGR
jgi:molybdopterin synthase catalytic subunit